MLSEIYVGIVADVLGDTDTIGGSSVARLRTVTLKNGCVVLWVLLNSEHVEPRGKLPAPAGT